MSVKSNLESVINLMHWARMLLDLIKKDEQTGDYKIGGPMEMKMAAINGLRSAMTQLEGK